MYVPFWVYYSTVLFCVLSVCKCVLYYCYRASTQLQITNISYIISYQSICLSFITLHAKNQRLFFIYLLLLYHQSYYRL